MALGPLIGAIRFFLRLVHEIHMIVFYFFKAKKYACVMEFCVPALLVPRLSSFFLCYSLLSVNIDQRERKSERAPLIFWFSGFDTAITIGGFILGQSGAMEQVLPSLL